MRPAFVVIIAALVLAGCESVPERPPAGPDSKRKLIVALARQEWIFFGRQKIRYEEEGETISPVGAWEDDDPQSGRVQRYWAAVGRPDLTGKDCQEPWSAAFVSWVMRTAGVPLEQFHFSIAHWVYLEELLRHGDTPGRAFAVRPLLSYVPQPGDLVCATRGDTRIPASDVLPDPDSLKRAKLHCNIVVEVAEQELMAIGGNVRNSVSEVALPLDGAGHLRFSPQRRWFLVVENRLP